MFIPGKQRVDVEAGLEGLDRTWILPFINRLSPAGSRREKAGIEGQGLIDVLERLVHHVVLEAESRLIELILGVLFFLSKAGLLAEDMQAGTVNIWMARKRIA